MKDSTYYRLRPIFEAAAPAIFTPRGKMPVAAKPGINREVIDLLAAHLSGTMVRNFLWRWFSRPEYLAVIAQGGQRYDLQGLPAGEILDEERDKAKAALIDRLARETRSGAGCAWVAKTLDLIGADESLRQQVREHSANQAVAGRAA